MKRNRETVIKQRIKEAKNLLKQLEAALALDMSIKVVSGHIYEYIPDCEINYYGNISPNSYKPINFIGNQWILLRRSTSHTNKTEWRAMNQGKIYNKKDPTAANFLTHYGR